MTTAGTTCAGPGAHAARLAIETYIRAKDENRPFLMERAFAADVRLEFVVKTGTIAFPPVSTGIAAVTDVLVRRFAQAYENIHTFCLAQPPEGHPLRFSCDWLVGMSEKDGGHVRVGCGRYDWEFAPHEPRRTGKLTITIVCMETLGAECLAPVMAWLSGLPYPWCAAPAALPAMPQIEGLAPVRGFLSRVAR